MANFVREFQLQLPPLNNKILRGMFKKKSQLDKMQIEIFMYYN